MGQKSNMAQNKHLKKWCWHNHQGLNFILVCESLKEFLVCENLNQSIYSYCMIQFADSRWIWGPDNYVK